MRTRLVLAALAAVSVSACTREPSAAPVPEGAGQGPEYVSGEEKNYVDGWVRIRLADDAGALRVGCFTRGAAESGNRAIDEAAARLGATEIRRVFAEGGRFAERRRRFGLHLWYDIRIGDDVPVTRAAGDLASVPGVSHVQPVYRIRWADNPRVLPAEYLYTPVRAKFADGAAPVNDPEIGKQWHYHNDGSAWAWKTGADINLFEAWEKFNAGRPEVIVAVVDMGVQYDHPDLAANMWVNEAELNGAPGVDDDGNGYVDDVYGYNFDKDTGAIEPGGHGTHCAGTIAAVNNNGIGVCGVAGGTGNGDGARIMSIQMDPGAADARYADAFGYSVTVAGDTEFNAELRAEDRYGNVSEPYAVTVKSLPHINRPPTMIASVNDFTIQQVGTEYARRFDLSMYYSDPDVGEFGDELTYGVSSDPEGIVRISVEGSVAVFEPVGIGAAAVVVKASDRAGAYAEDRFTVSVIHKGIPDTTIEGVGQEHALVLPLAEYFYAVEGMEYKYAAESSDPSKVRVSIGQGSLHIVPVAAGSAAVTISCKPGTGASVESQFLVTVTGGETPLPEGGFALWPNPASEYVDIRVPGAAGTVAVRIYDASARQVFDGTVTPDADGVGRLEVAALSPGAYSLVAEQDGHKFTAGFVKR